MRIGVLALQGDFAEHLAVLRRLGVEAIQVRRADQLADIDGLVMPGGESTTIGKLATDFGLVGPLRERIEAGLPVLATCAGLILLASDVGIDQPLIGGMDIAVERNAFGRQLESFETELDVAGLGWPPVRAVFIRAPAIRSVGPDVEVLARLADGRIVAAQQGHLLVAAFHPELSGDTRLHERFLEACARRAEGADRRARSEDRGEKREGRDGAAPQALPAELEARAGAQAGDLRAELGAVRGRIRRTAARGLGAARAPGRP